ncbi:MAG: hypothetical protein JNK89_02205 [Saprospiraceae bacterium]|nr:hypothetical protein [Saprospiraceae bacterium]
MNKWFWFCLFWSSTSCCAQSGWTRAPKSWFAKLDVSNLRAVDYYNPDGDRITTSAFQQSSLNFYGEYGFRERLTFVIQAPLLRLNKFETTNIAAGQGDLRLEAKYLLSDNRFPIAFSLAAELPTGRANAYAENKVLAGDRINLPTGDGEFNLWSTLAASRSIGRLWYASTFAAYNFRTRYAGKSFRNLYQFGAEIGFHPWDPLWLNAKLRAQFSQGKSRHPDLGFVRGDATTYTLLAVEALYKFNNSWGIAASYLTGGDWIAPLQNIYVAPYFSVGLIFER